MVLLCLGLYEVFALVSLDQQVVSHSLYPRAPLERRAPERALSDRIHSDRCWFRRRLVGTLTDPAAAVHPQQTLLHYGGQDMSARFEQRHSIALVLPLVKQTATQTGQ